MNTQEQEYMPTERDLADMTAFALLWASEDLLRFGEPIDEQTAANLREAKANIDMALERARQ